MPNITYDQLDDAIENAPARPQAALWNETLQGDAVQRLAEIRRVIAMGHAAGVEIEVLASPDTLRSAGLNGSDNLDGANVVQGATPTFDLVRFKFCRHA
jgi:hypothetical protein